MKKEKKRKPLEVLRPGQRNEFFEALLRMRDSGDKRWHTMSPGMQLSAAAYETNRNAEMKKAS